MLYIILILVYIPGVARMFYQVMAIDEWTMIRHGSESSFSKYTSYLILCAFWPVTMWIQMYFRWLNVRDVSKLKFDYSAWMWCSKCNIKWRPTAYGPPAPDDFYCPQCGNAENAKPRFDLDNKIPEYRERSDTT